LLDGNLDQGNHLNERVLNKQLDSIGCAITNNKGSTGFNEYKPIVNDIYTNVQYNN